MDDAFATETEPAPTTGTVTLECRSLVLSYAHLRIREPSAEARLSASLADTGQASPVIVVRDADGRTVLIDGYRRVRALVRLGHDTVTAVVLGLHAADALVYCHRLETSRRRSALEEGWLLRELCEQGPLLRDIGRALGRSASWVSRRLGLIRVLPTLVEEAVRRGVMPPHGAMRSLIPLARANRAHCEQLVERLGNERITTRQIAALYTAWRAGDLEQRERIVQAPLLFLRATRAAAKAEPHDELGWLVRELGVTVSALGRVRESLERAAGVDPEVVRSARLRRAWRPVAAAWEAVRGKVEEPDAGPGYPSCDSAAQA
jgi:ParB/RepB/Spo0J family partition protein